MDGGQATAGGRGPADVKPGRSIIAACICCLACSCASLAPAQGTRAQIAGLAGLLAGDYLSAPGDGVQADTPILLRIRPVEPPPGWRTALYAEMRHGGPDGPVYRQRLYVFEESARGADPGAEIVMHALAFADGVAAARLIADPEVVVREGLVLHDALGAGCEMRWRREGAGFIGRVSRDTCLIVGRRGDQRRIEAETHIMPDAISQVERGYDLAGVRLFGSPDGAPGVWPRLGRH